MRKNFGAKHWLYPQPVLIIAAYDEAGTANAMNAAWGGVSGETEISMCVSAGHKTVKNLLARGAFTVSLGDAAHVTACDYLGLETGNRVPDKLQRAGLHASKAPFVDAPLLDELPLALECRLVSYDPSSGRLVGEIVNVSAAESVLDVEGKVDLEKLQPLSYDTLQHTYRKLGPGVGLAYQDGLKWKKG